MNDLVVPIRRVARVVFALFIILVAQLTYLQLIHADALENDPNNVRTLVNKFGIPRGDIVTADGQVLATSVDSKDELKFQRQYPQGPLYGHITGYQSFLVGNTGIENTYNTSLRGKRGESQNVPRVVLTIDSKVQSFIKDQLGTRTGAIVVMEAKTGAIVGMYSNPAFDPNTLAGHDSAAVQKAFNDLKDDPTKPSVSRAFAERYAPGSTFKIVTAASALEKNIATPERKFPVLSFFAMKQTDRVIKNFGGGACGSTLQHAFQQSCNTVFAQLGTELGNSFVTQMEKFGVGGTLVGDNNTGKAPPLDIAGAAGATGPLENSFSGNQPEFGYAGIGQGRVSLSPLGVALVTSAVANDGTIPTPHVVDHVETSDGTIIKRVGVTPWKTDVISVSTAETVKSFMTDVVRAGTGTRARVKGITVAGKTGTAQVDCAPGTVCAPHAWFTSFAPAENPQYVVTVYIDKATSTSSNQKLNDEASTGGALAAPIAQAIYKKLFEVK